MEFILASQYGNGTSWRALKLLGYWPSAVARYSPNREPDYPIIKLLCLFINIRNGRIFREGWYISMIRLRATSGWCLEGSARTRTSMCSVSIGRSTSRLKTVSQPRCSGICQGDIVARVKFSEMVKKWLSFEVLREPSKYFTKIVIKLS